MPAFFDTNVIRYLRLAVIRCFQIDQATEDVIADATELRRFLLGAKRAKATLLDRAVQNIRETRPVPDDLVSRKLEWIY